jgi:hypothetical protein
MFFLFSCGEKSKEQFTLVVFNQTPGSKVPLNKGVMIVARNKTLNKTLSIYGNSLTQLPSQVLLPNGDYQFFAYGFNGPAANAVFNTTLYCDIANNGNDIGLFGNSVQVNLSLHIETCPPLFAPIAFRSLGIIFLTSFIFCSIPPNISNYSSSCGNTMASPNSFIELSILRDDSLIGASPTPVFKWCYNLNNPSSTITNNKIPIGPDFRISLKKFSDNTCTTPIGGGPIIIPSLDNVVSLSSSSVGVGSIIVGNLQQIYINKNLL